jgi:hypothetical protein
MPLLLSHQELAMSGAHRRSVDLECLAERSILRLIKCGHLVQLRLPALADIHVDDAFSNRLQIGLDQPARPKHDRFEAFRLATLLHEVFLLNLNAPLFVISLIVKIS